MPVDSTGCERGPGRAHVRNLFLRVLGVIFLIAFLSLLSQVTLLFGRQGLLPAQHYLEAIRATHRLLDAPTVFWVTCSLSISSSPAKSFWSSVSTAMHSW